MARHPRGWHLRFAAWMKVTHGRLMTLGVMLVFLGSIRALETIGVEDAVSAGFLAAIIATLVTWAISS